MNDIMLLAAFAWTMALPYMLAVYPEKQTLVDWFLYLILIELGIYFIGKLL